MIFKHSFVCIFCDTRTTSGKGFKGGCGICDECNKIIPYTKKGQPFEGNRDVSYVLSPLVYEHNVRDAIMRYKFEGWQSGDKVFEYIISEYIKSFPHLSEFDAVIPVPISKKRYNERGFNQSLPLAQAVSKTARVPCLTDSLIKIRHTQRQSRLNSGQRYLNVKGAYMSKSDMQGKRILLVDDIYTTGVTMNECALTLKNAGASEVVGISLSIKIKKENILWI